MPIKNVMIFIWLHEMIKIRFTIDIQVNLKFGREQDIAKRLFQKTYFKFVIFLSYQPFHVLRKSHFN